VVATLEVTGTVVVALLIEVIELVVACALAETETETLADMLWDVC